MLFALCFSFVVCSTDTSPSLSTINIFVKSEDITPEVVNWYSSLPEHELQYLSDMISISYDYGEEDGYDTGYKDGLFASDAFQEGYSIGYDMGYFALDKGQNRVN